jgi:hypothetical protein
MAQALPEAFFLPDRDRLVPTAFTRGPWRDDVQHGGPPSALLARAIERFGDDAGEFSVARVTCDLVRPVPLTPLTVEVGGGGGGRQVQRVHARLLAGATEVARAVGVRIRRAEIALPPPRWVPPPPPPGPDGLAAFVFPFFHWEVAYHLGVEVRLAAGRWGAGPCAAWMRPAAPLIAGETTSAVASVLLVADAANGIAPVLDFAGYTFINPDLCVSFARPPVGAWTALDVRSTADASGLGLVRAELFDRDGFHGESVQSLLVTPRA